MCIVLRLPLQSSRWNRGPWARWRVLALVQFLVVSLGIPLPSPATSTDSSERFPCQGHACGCSTAAKCWTACCCMTQRQKLVWALENGVTPPAYVLEAAAREQALENELAQQRAATGRRPCCAKRVSQSPATESARATAPTAEHSLAVDSSSSPKPRSCCSTKSTTGRSGCDHAARTSPVRSVITWVLMIQAQRCQGESGGLFAVCAVAPPPVPVVSPVECALQGTMLPAVVVHPLVPALLPALPPPRVG